MQWVCVEYLEEPVYDGDREIQCLLLQLELDMDKHQPVHQDPPHPGVNGGLRAHVAGIRLVLHLKSIVWTSLFIVFMILLDRFNPIHPIAPV